EPPARTGPHVDQPAALREGGYDRLHYFRYVRQLFGNGLGYPPVFAVDNRQNFFDRQRVQVVIGAARFGDQATEVFYHFLVLSLQLVSTSRPSSKRRSAR